MIIRISYWENGVWNMKKLMRGISLFLSAAMFVTVMDLRGFAQEVQAGNETQNPYYVDEEDKVYDVQEEEQESYVLMELEDQREASVKHFLMSDNSVRAVVYAQPVHYEEDGKWENIDNSLQYQEESENYINTANDFQVRFAEETGMEEFIQIRQGEYGLDWKYADAESRVATPAPTVVPDEEVGEAIDESSSSSAEQPESTETPMPTQAPVESEPEDVESASEAERSEAVGEPGVLTDGIMEMNEPEIPSEEAPEPDVETSASPEETPLPEETPVPEATSEATSSPEPSLPSDAEETPPVEEVPDETEPTASPSSSPLPSVLPSPSAVPEIKQGVLNKTPLVILDATAAALNSFETDGVQTIEDVVELGMQSNAVNVAYQNALDNTDFKYQLAGKSLKENIVVYERQTQYVYPFELETHNLELIYDEEANEIRAVDPQNKETVFIIPSPVMFDDAGQSSTAVSYSLERTEENVYRFTVTADSTWINSEERVFPVSIDPAIATTTRQSVRTTMVASRVPNENCSDRYEWFVGTSDFYYGECWALLDFDLPTLNPSDIVIDAQMSLILRERSFSDTSRDLQVNAHAVTSDWERESVTWNTKPSYDPIVYDYDLVRTTDPEVGYTQKLFNITKAVRRWYDGTAENHGILLKPQTNTLINTGQFIPERYNDYPSGYYPYVVVTYRNNKGIEPYWNYTSASAGTAGDLSVNDFTGNAVLTHTDAATSGLLMPISVSHVYNGYLAGEDFTGEANFTDKLKPFAGYGWKLNLYQMVRPSSLYGLSGESAEKWPYVYTDGDGTEHYFMETDDGTIKDEDGLNLELKTVSGGYTIEDDQGNRMTFDSKGNLTKIQDANGNTASLTYSGDLITKVTDGAGHSITLENDGTHLTKITDPAGKSTTYTYSSGLLTRITYPDGTYSEYAYD